MNEETLLVVDDNQALCEGLVEMLSYEGFTVLTAANGREALKCMDKAAPDLILSDITMPVMDGYAFFSAVRSRSDWVTIPFIFLTARSDKEDVLTGKNLGAEDYLVKPLSREELVTAIRSRLTRSQQVQVAQVQQAYLASLTALADAIDLRDRYARGHIERVTAYALVLAPALEWPAWRLDHLRLGAILHDIGKIHIAETTLFKPSCLSEEEMAEIRKHPLTGSEMIRDIPYLAPVVPIVRSHHERWDGGGYPDGLSGNEIPLGARIVALADSLDSMTSERAFSPARSLSDAYEEVLNCAGKQFDPVVVTAFEQAWQAQQIHSIATRWRDE